MKNYIFKLNQQRARYVEITPLEVSHWVLQAYISLISTLNAPQLCHVSNITLRGRPFSVLCMPLSKQRHCLHWRPISKPHRKADTQLPAETAAQYLNRKLDFMWLAKHYSALGCIQEVCITPLVVSLKTVTSSPKWHIRERINPSPAAFSINVVRLAQSREDRRARGLRSLSSPSCGISSVSVMCCFYT